jgi:3-dehydroquinate dehydratase/shikimate dehydrogenase
LTSICVSLSEDTTSKVIDRMVDLAGVADMFEVRGDRVLDLDLLTILRARTRPLLFSCRPVTMGGFFKGDEQRRRLVLLEAVKRGFDYVDVEYESGFLDVAIEKSGGGLVVSHHDFAGTPDDLDALYAGMASRGADVVKLAVTPRTIADVGRLMRLAREVDGRGGPPLVAVAMGPMGVITRVAAGRWNAPFTFASAAVGAETAAGQVPASLMADLYRVRDVTRRTRVYGVLGEDVERSLSPVLHNRAFAARAIDAVYVPLPSASLAAFLQALPDLQLSGFSVTRPFKVEIVPHLHDVADSARQAGSVNTVLVTGDRLEGFTTDGAGVLAPLARHLDVSGRSVVILGAGGAARAAATALHLRGAHVVVLGRDAAAAAAVGAALGCAHGALSDLATFSWDVLLNATPVGSGALRERTLVDAPLHRPGTVVFDMVYDPLETRLLREARAAGCTVVGGLEMLLAQAESQFEIWTGQEAPLGEMKSAALWIAQQQERAS